MIDLTRSDTYEDSQVPDSHVEICMKVLRTIRNCCLGPHFFDADGAVILSHAHMKIHDLCVESNKLEAEEALKHKVHPICKLTCPTGSENGTCECTSPDQCHKRA